MSLEVSLFQDVRHSSPASPGMEPSGLKRQPSQEPALLQGRTAAEGHRLLGALEARSAHEGLILNTKKISRPGGLRCHCQEHHGGRAACQAEDSGPAKGGR